MLFELYTPKNLTSTVRTQSLAYFGNLFFMSIKLCGINGS